MKIFLILILLFVSINTFAATNKIDDPEQIPLDTPISVTLSGVFEEKNFYIVTNKDGYLVCDVSQTNPNGTYGAHFVLNWEGGCCGEMISANITGTDNNQFIGNSAGAGRYNITLENGSGGENTITFKIVLDPIRKKNDHESNDTYDSADILQLNSVKTGHINFVNPSNRNVDDIDIFEVNSTTSGNFSLKLKLDSTVYQPENNLAWIALLDSNLNLISEDSALQKAMITYSNMRKGKYFVRVIARQRTGNPYIYGNSYTISDSFYNVVQTLPDYLPQKGLVAWYPFNGNANDESGNGNNGTLFGAIKTKDRFGNSASAYKFDGTTYIKGSSTNFPTQNRTVSIWYKIDDWNNHNTLMGYGGGICGTSFFAVLNPSDSHLFATDSHCGQNTVATSNKYSENSNWNNWIITSNGVKTTFYLNGEKIYDTIMTYNGTDVIGKDFALGSMSSSSGIAPYSDQNVSYLKGALDDVAIYNRVLSSKEIHQLYCACVLPSITIANKSILEGNTGTRQLQFPVTLNNAYSDTVKINYQTKGNTAKGGIDYIGTNGTLIFKPGQTSKIISVSIIGDTEVEPDETFYVILSNPVNAAIGTDTAVGKIRNDDTALILKNESEHDAAIQSTRIPTQFSIYPNPVKDVLYVQANSNSTFYLSNAQGKTILKKKIRNFGDIDCSSLPEGIYFLKNGLTGTAQKVIIAR